MLSSFKNATFIYIQSKFKHTFEISSLSLQDYGYPPLLVNVLYAGQRRILAGQLLGLASVERSRLNLILLKVSSISIIFLVKFYLQGDPFSLDILFIVKGYTFSKIKTNV